MIIENEAQYKATEACGEQLAKAFLYCVCEPNLPAEFRYIQQEIQQVLADMFVARREYKNANHDHRK